MTIKNLVPIAVSSQLDITGEERIHAAIYDPQTTVLIPSTCATPYTNKQAFAYGVTIYTNSYGDTLGDNVESIKYALATYDPVSHAFEDAAVISFGGGGTAKKYADITTDGTYVYAIVSKSASTYKDMSGLWAMIPNYGSRELEVLAQYTPHALGTYISVVASNGSILVSYINGAGDAVIDVLSFNGTTFTVTDTRTVIAASNLEVYIINHGAYVIGTDLNFPTTLYSFSVSGGLITAHGTYTLADELEGPLYSQPIISDGTYIYTDRTQLPSGPNILSFNGSTFTLLYDGTGISATNTKYITAGGGFFFRVINDNASPAQVEVRTWDGATLSAPIQTINCWNNSMPYYDVATQRLFIPNDSNLVSRNSGVYKWDSGSNLFVQEASVMAIEGINAFYAGFPGHGAQNQIRPLKGITLPSLERVCLNSPIYYAYIVNKPFYQASDSTVKVGYGYLDTGTKKYTDLATVNLGQGSVYLSGGLAVQNGFIIANTGYDDYTETDVTRRKAGIYALKPNRTTGRINVIASYTVTRDPAQTCSFFGPCLHSSGDILVAYYIQGQMAKLVGLNFNGSAFSVVGTFDIDLDARHTGTQSMPMKMMGDTLITYQDKLRAYTYAAGVFTEIVAPTSITVGYDEGYAEPSIQIVGSKIILKHFSGGHAVDVVDFNGMDYTQEGTLTLPFGGGGLVTFQDGSDIIIGADVQNTNPAIFNAFNRLQFYRYTSPGTFSSMLQEIGHSPGQSLYYDTANHLLFEPYPAGYLYGGMADITGHTSYIPDGIYSWNGSTFDEYAPRFAYAHSTCQSDVIYFGSMYSLITTPKLH